MGNDLIQKLFCLHVHMSLSIIKSLCNNKCVSIQDVTRILSSVQVTSLPGSLKNVAASCCYCCYRIQQVTLNNLQNISLRYYRIQNSSRRKQPCPLCSTTTWKWPVQLLQLICPTKPTDLQSQQSLPLQSLAKFIELQLETSIFQVCNLLSRRMTLESLSSL